MDGSSVTRFENQNSIAPIPLPSCPHALNRLAARHSRNQYDPTTDEHGWTRIREKPVLIRVNPCPSVVKKSSRASTVSRDTDTVVLKLRQGATPSPSPQPVESFLVCIGLGRGQG